MIKTKSSFGIFIANKNGGLGHLIGRSYSHLEGVITACFYTMPPRLPTMGFLQRSRLSLEPLEYPA